MRRASPWQVCMNSSVRKVSLSVLGACGGLALLVCLPKAPSPAPASQAEVGIALGKNGRLPEATALLRQVIAQEPQLFRAHFGLGMLSYQAKRYETAEREFRLAATCPHATPDNLFMLGATLQKLNRFQEALPIYQGLVAKMPNEPSYAFNLGMLANQMGDAPLARRQLSAYLRLAPMAPDRESVAQLLATLKGS